jgi:hypothetical protein
MKPRSGAEQGLAVALDRPTRKIRTKSIMKPRIEFVGGLAYLRNAGKSYTVNRVPDRRNQSGDNFMKADQPSRSADSRVRGRVSMSWQIGKRGKATDAPVRARTRA